MLALQTKMGRRVRQNWSHKHFNSAIRHDRGPVLRNTSWPIKQRQADDAYFPYFQWSMPSLVTKNFVMINVIYYIVTDGKGGRGWKLGKVGPSFTSFNDMPAKITKKNCDG